MLRVKNVSFAYESKMVLKNLNLEVQKGDHVSIIGESGCGKSTLLQLIYGLHHTEGKIYWEDRELLGPNFNLVPGEAFIKYLAQDFDLMLPLTAAENVGKYLSNMYPGKKKKRIKQLLEVVEMKEMANVKAGNLSGGQQQRVALARALAKEPELLLLDEPFSHIDHFRKNNLRRNVYTYLKENNITCLTATHDSTDALSFADKTIVLKNGKKHAEERPENLYKNPPDKYVASLFGDVNEIRLKDLIPGETGEEKILLYPHEINIDPVGKLQAQVLKNYFKGSTYEIKAAFKEYIIYLENDIALPEGNTISLQISETLINSRRK